MQNESMNSFVDNPELLSVEDLAKLLGVPPATIYGWRYRGLGPIGFKVGRHLRFKRSDAVAWIEQQRSQDRSTSANTDTQ